MTAIPADIEKAIELYESGLSFNQVTPMVGRKSVGALHAAIYRYVPDFQPRVGGNSDGYSSSDSSYSFPTHKMQIKVEDDAERRAEKLAWWQKALPEARA